jgi:imidazolonepropionase-like amidohydrolase
MRVTVLFVAALGAAAAFCPAAVAKTVVVSADKLVDVASGKTSDKPQLIIVDGRITKVGKQGDLVPAGATRVDLPGVTLLPGLIDMHTHLSSSPLYGGYNSLLFTDSFWAIISARHATLTSPGRVHHRAQRRLQSLR